jgi:hypothetical protein
MCYSVLAVKRRTNHFLPSSISSSISAKGSMINHADRVTRVMLANHPMSW